MPKKIKHYSSKHREMLDGEKVGHFLLMISGIVARGHSNLKYKVKSWNILNIGYTILYNIMLKIVYNVELLQINGLMKIN